MGGIVEINLKEMYDFSILRELRKREGLNILDVSKRSGVSPAVISKLERNQTAADLKTIYRLSRVLSINASDLIALAEQVSAKRKSTTEHTSDGFKFKEIRYDNARILFGTAKAGCKVSKPKIHSDDFEICWVIKGKVLFELPNEKFELEEGDSIQFDALLKHSYASIEDTEMIIIHIKKRKF
jgi:transcriptional regulator with XRE-family HTH domain